MSRKPLLIYTTPKPPTEADSLLMLEVIGRLSQAATGVSGQIFIGSALSYLAALAETPEQCLELARVLKTAAGAIQARAASA